MYFVYYLTSSAPQKTIKVTSIFRFCSEVLHQIDDCYTCKVHLSNWVKYETDRNCNSSYQPPENSNTRAWFNKGILNR